MSFNPNPACGPSSSIADITATTDVTPLKLFYTDSGGAGLITSGYDNPYYNVTSATWSDPNGYIQKIKGIGTGNVATKSGGLIVASSNSPTPSVTVDTTQASAASDTELLSRIKSEYCFYNTRYEKYIGQFLDASTRGNTALATKALDLAQDYNNKLNALIILVDVIANTRAGYVNARTAAFNELNKQLNDMRASGPAVAAETLKAENAVLNTRKEMIRYTKEKNNSITNHISLWAALNVVAIAMIFTLYRKM